MPTTSRAVENKPEKRKQTAKRKRKAAPQTDKPSEITQAQDIIKSPHLIQYLQSKKLLAAEVKCRCRKPMTLRVLRQYTDGFAFRYALGNVDVGKLTEKRGITIHANNMQGKQPDGQAVSMSDNENGCIASLL
ncbi:hypothetical protein SprV_0200850800 [Sparganum proliferum]